MNEVIKQEHVKIGVTPDISVAGVQGIPAWWPSGHRVGVVIAHDTPEGMEHEAVVALHQGLAERGFLTLRFNFPFVEQGKKRPDPVPILERTYRAAVTSLLQDPQTGPARLILAGFGLGATTAAQVVSQGMIADGVVSLGFPLHPSGKPNQLRAEPLFRIISPMLFVQGSRDAYCRVDRLEGVLRRVGAPTKLQVIEDADHEFGLIRRTNRTIEEIRTETLNAVEAFVRQATGSH